MQNPFMPCGKTPGYPHYTQSLHNKKNSAAQLYTELFLTNGVLIIFSFFILLLYTSCRFLPTSYTHDHVDTVNRLFRKLDIPTSFLHPDEHIVCMFLLFVDKIARLRAGGQQLADDCAHAPASLLFPSQAREWPPGE